MVNWDGSRAIGGWGGGPTNPDSLTVRHADFMDESGWVEVTTHVGDAAEATGSRPRDDLEERLVEFQFPRPLELTDEDFRQQVQDRQRSIQRGEPPDWQPTSFRVDDYIIPGQITRAGTHWVAYFRTDGFVVEMAGNTVDPDQIQLSR